MVVFTCNGCGESIKKNQVTKHRYRCGVSQSMSCMDCNEDFWDADYIFHVKCITENQKYGGKDYQPKSNSTKGLEKQEKWIEKINAAVASQNLSGPLARILNDMLSYNNIPRKKGKFERFVRNSFRVSNRKLINEAWEIFSRCSLEGNEAAESNKAPKTNKNKSGDKVKAAMKKNLEKQRNKLNKKLRTHENEFKTEAYNNISIEKFAWRKKMRKILQAEGHMPPRALRKRNRNWRREIMARGEGEIEESGLKSHFVERVVKLPMVHVAWDYASNTYSHIKGSSKLVNFTLTNAEKSVNFVAGQAKPVVLRFGKQIQAVDKLACKGLGTLEEKVPFITKPADEIIGDTRKLYTQTVYSRLEGIRKYGTDTVKSVTDYGLEKANVILSTRLVQSVLTSVDGALVVTENYIDHVLPPVDGENQNDANQEKADKRKGLMRAAHITNKVRHRAYRNLVVKFEYAQERTVELLLTYPVAVPYDETKVSMTETSLLFFSGLFFTMWEATRKCYVAHGDIHQFSGILIIILVNICLLEAHVIILIFTLVKCTVLSIYKLFRRDSRDYEGSKFLSTVSEIEEFLMSSSPNYAQSEGDASSTSIPNRSKNAEEPYTPSHKMMYNLTRKNSNL